MRTGSFSGWKGGGVFPTSPAGKPPPLYADPPVGLTSPREQNDRHV